MKERISQLSNFLFELQRLKEEGKMVDSLEAEVWEKIKEEIHDKVDRERAVGLNNPKGSQSSGDHPNR